MPKSSSDDLIFGNRILDALPVETLERLHPHLETVALVASQPVQEPGETTEHAYFPTRGVISLVAMMSGGESVEVGMIGKEGMFGVSAILGDDAPSQRAMVQIAGSALRMKASVLQQEAKANGELQALLLRYAQVT